jgi:hypothetical protein
LCKAIKAKKAEREKGKRERIKGLKRGRRRKEAGGKREGRSIIPGTVQYLFINMRTIPTYHSSSVLYLN